MPTGTVYKAAFLELIRHHDFHVCLFRHLNFFFYFIEKLLSCLNCSVISHLPVRQSYAILKTSLFKESGLNVMNLSKFEAQTNTTNKIDDGYYSFLR